MRHTRNPLGLGLLTLVVAAALFALPDQTRQASAQTMTPTANADGSYTVPFDWPMKPGRTQPGGKFRLLFVTSGTRNAASADIEDYNRFVQNQAANGHVVIQPYADQFKVLASTATVDARDNTMTTGTGVQINWVGVSAPKVADSYTDFYDGSWDNQQWRDQSGRVGPHRDVFTGSNNDGTKHSPDPLGSGNNVRYGRSGRDSKKDGHSPFNHSWRSQSHSRNFYALSPVFVVDPATPRVSVDFATTDTYGVHRFHYNVREGSVLRPRLRFNMATPAAVNLTVIATPGTAISDVDFPSGPHTFTVPAGVRSHAFDIPIPSDAELEDYETFTLTIDVDSLPDGYKLRTLGQPDVQVQIVNVSVVSPVWSLIPPGLGAGDQFRLLFKTGNERDATSTDIAEYDAFVRARTSEHPWHADIEPYASTFRVVGSTSAVDASWHTATGVTWTNISHTPWHLPIYWLNGVKITNDRPLNHDRDNDNNLFWWGRWGEANSRDNQRHADGLPATNTNGATTGSDRCCTNGNVTHQAGTGVGNYSLGSSGGVIAGSGNRWGNAIAHGGAGSRHRTDNAPFYGLSAVFEVPAPDNPNVVVMTPRAQVLASPADQYPLQRNVANAGEYVRFVFDAGFTRPKTFTGITTELAWSGNVISEHRPTTYERPSDQYRRGRKIRPHLEGTLPKGDTSYDRTFRINTGDDVDGWVAMRLRPSESVEVYGGAPDWVCVAVGSGSCPSSWPGRPTATITRLDGGQVRAGEPTRFRVSLSPSPAAGETRRVYVTSAYQLWNNSSDQHRLYEWVDVDSSGSAVYKRPTEYSRNRRPNNKPNDWILRYRAEIQADIAYYRPGSRTSDSVDVVPFTTRAVEPCWYGHAHFPRNNAVGDPVRYWLPAMSQSKCFTAAEIEAWTEAYDTPSNPNRVWTTCKVDTHHSHLYSDVRGGSHNASAHRTLSPTRLGDGRCTAHGRDAQSQGNSIGTQGAPQDVSFPDPGTLAFSEVTAESMTVSWPAREVDHYTVRWAQADADADQLQSADVDSGTLRHTITGLTPGTRYVVVVQSQDGEAVTVAGYQQTAKAPVCAPQLPADAVGVSEVTAWRDAHDHKPDHVLRWNQVLEALGEDTGSGAVPMTADQSRANESRFMASRWDRVTRTLQAIAQCAHSDTTTPDPVADPDPVTDPDPVVDDDPVTDPDPVVDDDPVTDPDPVVDDDDDPPTTLLPPKQVSFSAEDASAIEGETLRFRIMLSDAADARVRVYWRTRYSYAGEISAFPDVDYPSRARGWIAFDPGDTEKWVDIALPDDTVAEPAEVFQIYLSFTEGGATIADRDATMTITDND